MVTGPFSFSLFETCRVLGFGREGLCKGGVLDFSVIVDNHFVLINLCSACHYFLPRVIVLRIFVMVHVAIRFDSRGGVWTYYFQCMRRSLLELQM